MQVNVSNSGGESYRMDYFLRLSARFQNIYATSGIALQIPLYFCIIHEGKIKTGQCETLRKHGLKASV
jgi:hypothetical protein